MIVEFKNDGCARCGSANTDLQILVPDRCVTRGCNEKFSAEIVCRDCGKIHRTEKRVKIHE